MELKGEIIDARAEVEKCAIESQYSIDDGDFGHDAGERLPDLERQTSQQTMEKFLGSSWTEKQMEEFPTSSLSNPLPIASARNARGIHPEIQRLLKSQSQDIEGQNTTVEKLTSSLDLPKREFLCFDGNPTTYLRFIKNFEVNVESRVPDETVRLSYLIQYTSGAARQAIENCVKELPRLLERGGFNFTKWVSNREVTTAIPVEKRASVVDLDLEKSRIDRALGVQWDIDNDTFGYKVGKREAVDTRRKILSLVSSIYDPLGIAAPLLLPAKKILQDLCRNLIGWDKIILPELYVNWEKWIDNLPGLERLAIPRCLKPETFGTLSSIQLHYFADASEIGYWAVSYLRLVDVSGSIHCILLMGKSRVALLKLLIIPRLELSAATVAVKLHKLILYELELPILPSSYNIYGMKLEDSRPLRLIDWH